MSEDELRRAMSAYRSDLPTEDHIRGWAHATGFTEDRVREIYGEEVRRTDDWGPSSSLMTDV